MTKIMDSCTAAQLEEKISKKLDASYVQAVDTSDGCGGKFEVTVVAEAFRGKTLLQQHRLVNAALTEELQKIHAFSQKTYTPEQWEKVQGNSQ